VNRDLLIWFVVIAGFVAIGVLTFSFGFESIGGIGLIIVGSVTVFFAHNIAKAQKNLAAKPFVPDHWKGVRPFTFALWGTGVAILGVIWLIHFATKA
jgi:hypothetical protein